MTVRWTAISIGSMIALAAIGWAYAVDPRWLDYSFLILTALGVLIGWSALLYLFLRRQRDFDGGVFVGAIWAFGVIIWSFIVMVAIQNPC